MTLFQSIVLDFLVWIFGLKIRTELNWTELSIWFIGNRVSFKSSFCTNRRSNCNPIIKPSQMHVFHEKHQVRAEKRVIFIIHKILN